MACQREKGRNARLETRGEPAGEGEERAFRDPRQASGRSIGARVWRPATRLVTLRLVNLSRSPEVDFARIHQSLAQRWMGVNRLGDVSHFASHLNG